MGTHFFCVAFHRGPLPQTRWLHIPVPLFDHQDIGDAKNLTLDLKDVQYISSAGLRVLLGAQKKMQKIGSMKVVNVCEAVMEVFEMTGFADILVIE